MNFAAEWLNVIVSANPYIGLLIACLLFIVRASDKRIACDEQFSDSEDEGEGGRRHRESFKNKTAKRQRMMDPAKKDGNCSLFWLLVLCVLVSGEIIVFKLAQQIWIWLF